MYRLCDNPRLSRRSMKLLKLSLLLVILSAYGFLGYAVTQPQSQDEQKWRDEQKDFWERQLSLARELNWITLFAGVIGFGGLIILYFTLKATQEAVDAAKESSETAKIALQITHRARIGIKNFTIGNEHPRGISDEPEEPLIRYELVNNGNLPATGLVHSVWFEKPPETLRPRKKGEWEIIDPRASTKKRRLLLRKSDVEGFHYELFLEVSGAAAHEGPVISREQWDGLQDDALFGISVIYWDGFDHQRITEVRYRFNTEAQEFLREYYRED